MKATRLQQDLERVSEAADRATALDAVAKRLLELQAAVAKLAPLTPDGKAKADAAKATLAAVAKRLASAAAGGDKAEKAAEDF